jgi:putative ABC transport system substrate-binding protein
MRRRDFIKAIAGSTAVWPLATRAQQGGAMRRLGVLVGNASSADDPLAQKELNPFRDAMQRAGWIEGKTIQIEYRYGAGNPAEIETSAEELVGLAPDVIYSITL